ncbi:hypothetical protein ACWEOO_06750 [Kribbella sp. NPDC004138]
MITSLLPGLRDLRVPLAVGYAWLTVFWFLIGGSLPTEQDAVGVLARVYQLGHVVGSTAMLAALTFIAYTLGAVVTSNAATAYFATRVGRALILLSKKHCWFGGTLGTLGLVVLRYGRASRGNTGLRYWRQRSLTEGTYMDLRREVDLLAAPIEQRNGNGAEPSVNVGGPDDLLRDAGGDETDVVVRQVLGEMPQLVTRLHIQDRERLYHAYDRLASEADLRANLVVPAFALVVVLTATTGNAWWLLGTPVPVVFSLHAADKRRRARSEVIQALIHGQIESSTLSALRGGGATITSIVADSPAASTPGGSIG